MRALLSKITLALILAGVPLTALPQELSINDGGIWRNITEVYVNDAGVWREIQEIWVNDAGTWRLVFTNSTPTITNATFTDQATSPANAGVELFLESDGDLTVSETDDTGGVAVDQGDWLTPKVGMANFDVRCTVNTGTLTSGSVCDGVTWLNLGTTRSWRIARITDTPGLSSVNITLEIRRTSTGVVLDTASYTLEAAVTA